MRLLPLDSFVDPEDGNIDKDARIHLGKDRTEEFYKLAREAKGMMLCTLINESRNHGKFDLKRRKDWGGVYAGYRIDGKYASIRQIGNMLAGVNFRLYAFSYDQFQRAAGMQHKGKGWWGIIRGYLGDSVGEAPYYGENAYQYESSKYGWDVLYGKFNSWDKANP